MEHNRARHCGISASQSGDSDTMHEITPNQIFRSNQSKMTETKTQQTPAEKLPNSNVELQEIDVVRSDYYSICRKILDI